MEKFEWKRGMQHQNAVNSISGVAGDLEDPVIERRLSAALTVEAAMIMAIVLWAMFAAIQAAYRLRDETVGSMAAQFTVQILRTDEETDVKEAEQRGEVLAGHSFSWKEYGVDAEYRSHILGEDEVSVCVSGGKWGIAISQRVFDPENFLRRISLTEQE